jgi:tRNA-modifying protein YgfZ
MTSPTPPAESVFLFDRSDRLRMRFSGPKAGEALTGLVTNDVLSLVGGDGLYACALTAKGRIIADVRILAYPPEGTPGVETYLADTNAAAGSGFAAMIRKYVNPRLAKYADVTTDVSCTTISGDHTFALLRAVVSDGATLDALDAGAMFMHRAAELDGVPVRLVRVPDLGARLTVDIHCDAAHAGHVRATLTGAGAVDGDRDTWRYLRLMAGRPEWGLDMDESTLAQEANMDLLEAISYRKGCYTGQETVARVHFRGHVNRTLRRVRIEDPMLPARETELRGADDALVGHMRSSAWESPSRGVGLAMIRREVPAGAQLRLVDDSGTSGTVRVIDSVESA